MDSNKKLSEKILKSARKIWNYHQLNHRLEKSDVIFVQGSHDIRVAERGSQLFLDRFAPYLLVSGGLGRITKNKFNVTEADRFAKIAIDMGVPQDKILMENKSSNTGENVLFSYQILQQKKIKISKMILVQKPYMERRAYATFKQQWPEKKVEILVTSPKLSFDEYSKDEKYRNEMIDIMVGDLQRIKIYPEKGFQIFQEIPKDVWKEYEFLVGEGFKNHLIES